MKKLIVMLLIAGAAAASAQTSTRMPVPQQNPSGVLVDTGFYDRAMDRCLVSEIATGQYFFVLPNQDRWDSERSVQEVLKACQRPVKADVAVWTGVIGEEYAKLRPGQQVELYLSSVEGFLHDLALWKQMTMPRPEVVTEPEEVK
jgi:hypothetical protein